MTQLPVLVTGGAGYIGSHAVLALKDAGWPVAVIDNLTTGFRRAVPKGVPFYPGDIADEALLARIFAERGTRAVMHFAGSVVVAESVENPLDYYLNNTVRSHALIAAAVTAQVPHFIFSSTAAIYGISEVSPVSEDSPKQPINPYGMSKLMTEAMLVDAARAHPLNYCALRYFNVAGADPFARSGQSTAGATHLIKVAVEAALGKRDHVSVFGCDYDTPDGTGVRDYIHVSDLATAHVLALEALIAEPERSLTMNCGYGIGFSVIEVLDAVDRVSDRKLDRRMEPRREGDPDSLVSDNRRIRATLPWQPRYADLDTIVGHALAWERKLQSSFHIDAELKHLTADTLKSKTNLNSLLTLEYLSLYGTCAQVASELQVTPLAIARRLRRLEKRLDLPLLEDDPQDKRRMRLTQTGESLTRWFALLRETPDASSFKAARLIDRTSSDDPAANDQLVDSSTELWRVLSVSANYEVSSLGRLRRRSSGRVMRPSITGSGFAVVNIYNAGQPSSYTVHTLVAQTFLNPKPRNCFVVHLNGDRTDNRIHNLFYKSRNFRSSISESDAKSLRGKKITLAQANEVRRRANAGESTSSLAREFLVSEPLISQIKKGLIWRTTI